MIKHTDLIDAVNNAKTQYEHDIAYARLKGWRDGRSDWCGASADAHTMTRVGPYRPMFCGVLLDWAPDSGPWKGLQDRQ